MKSALMLMVILAPSFAAAATLTGSWTYNNDLSTESQPKAAKGSVFGGFSGGVVVAGLPIPIPGGSQGQATTSSPKDPDALYAQTMTIEEYEDRIVVIYGNLGTREFVPGKHLGRKTKWNGKKLSESYETTTRRVRQTYELNRDGRMLVTVKISPNGAKNRTYKRVFDRADI